MTALWLLVLALAVTVFTWAMCRMGKEPAPTQIGKTCPYCGCVGYHASYCEYIPR